MTRFETDLSAQPPPTEQEESVDDTLFRRWLTRAPTSHPRVRVAASPQPSEREPLGDELADRWFR
jgi:hypothetical protein